MATGAPARLSRAKLGSVNNTQFGIALAGDPGSGSADHNIVTKNTVSATHIFDGIDLCGNNNTASNNTINGSDEAGVHVDDTCTGATGNTATYNIINSAARTFARRHSHRSRRMQSQRS